ncbi:MAG: hypothetical protein QOF51_4138 [Chloroflexota bacterium]|jgi:hypothetical protein|nr:hypothetical protein [Chloroflexota bacterium]
MSVDGNLIRLFYDLWDDTRVGREYLVANEPQEQVDKVARPHLREVHDAMASFDRIGHLIERGVLDEDFVTSLVGREIIRVGGRMQPFIADERTKRKDPSAFLFAEELINRSRKAFPTYEPVYAEEEQRRREERPAFGLRS